MLIIGDRFDTDVRAGVRVGLRTCLVESGCHTAALQSFFPRDRADYVAANLGELLPTLALTLALALTLTLALALALALTLVLTLTLTLTVALTLTLILTLPRRAPATRVRAALRAQEPRAGPRPRRPRRDAPEGTLPPPHTHPTPTLPLSCVHPLRPMHSLCTTCTLCALCALSQPPTPHAPPRTSHPSPKRLLALLGPVHSSPRTPLPLRGAPPHNAPCPLGASPIRPSIRPPPTQALPASPLGGGSRRHGAHGPRCRIASAGAMELRSWMLARGNLVYAAAGSGGGDGGGDLPLMLKLHGFFNKVIRVRVRAWG